MYVTNRALRHASKLDANRVRLGADSNLSKRTLLYTNLGSAKRDTATRVTAIDFGVKHTF